MWALLAIAAVAANLAAGSGCDAWPLCGHRALFFRRRPVAQSGLTVLHPRIVSRELIMPVLLIAGGSRGIGAATARLAGARGYDVAVNYKSNANAAAERGRGGEGSPAARRSRCKATWRSEADIERVFDETARQARADHAFRAQRRHHRRLFAARRGRRRETMREVLDVDTLGACCACATACGACRPSTAAKAARW